MSDPLVQISLVGLAHDDDAVISLDLSLGELRQIEAALHVADNRVPGAFGQIIGRVKRAAKTVTGEPREDEP